MTKIIEVLKEKNKEFKKEVALRMNTKQKSKNKGRNYVFKDLSHLVSKFNDNQMIKLSEILSMSEADLVELVILNIDNIKIWS